MPHAWHHTGFGRLDPRYKEAGESEGEVRRKKAKELPQDEWARKYGKKHQRSSPGTPSMRDMPQYRRREEE